MNMDPKTKFKLFRSNNNFCSAPWNLLYVQTQGKLKVCSASKIGTIGDLHTSTIEEIRSNPDFLKIKSDMLDDKVVPTCSNCRHLENHGDGVTSYNHLRNMYNQMFLDRDVDYTNITEFSLGALDLHWSSLCDLKCITCWHQQSSSIALEEGMPIRHTKTEVALKLIDQIIEKQSTLKEIYLSGGEPSLIKYNLNLLSRLEKRDNLLIRVNTNMMWDQDNSIIQEVLKFPQVLFTCSADNTERKFEYIRRGAKWNRFIENLNYLSTKPNVKIRINSVFFVLSALDLIDTIDYFNKNHSVVDFTINQCEMGHTYLRPRNLSDADKDLVRQKLQDGKIKYSNNITLVGSFNNCLNELDQPKTESYDWYFDKIDSLANTQFDTIFPELK
jgi:organic radical activating enzyme